MLNDGQEIALGGADKGLIVVLSAPAGTGKTTLVRRLIQEFPNVVPGCSYTTRQPRANETNGVDYNFVTEQEFKQRIEDGDFLEHVQLYGFHYGTSRSWVQAQCDAGKRVVLVIDTQGALQLRKCKERKIRAAFIFVAPPSMEELHRRLMKRKTESPEVIAQRLALARKEVEARVHYDYLIVNDDLDVAYDALKSIIIAEEHRIVQLPNIGAS